MANIIPADDIITGGGGLYLNADDKARLHRSQAPFYIVGAIAEADGQYGPQTIFTIKEEGKEEAKLAFGVNEQRKEQAKRISIAMANGADATGPFYLGRWDNGRGQGGWELTKTPTEVRDITPVSPAATDAGKRELKAVVVGDDLPF
jgi:hypothetical protein